MFSVCSRNFSLKLLQLFLWTIIRDIVLRKIIDIKVHSNTMAYKKQLTVGSSHLLTDLATVWFTPSDNFLNHSISSVDSITAHLWSPKVFCAQFKTPDLRFVMTTPQSTQERGLECIRYLSDLITESTAFSLVWLLTLKHNIDFMLFVSDES
jgi:hypothetical protein